MCNREDILNVHNWVPVSLVNGPGKRSVIWLQGCCFDCPGCFNPDARLMVLRKPMSVAQIVDNLPYGEIEGITISGGEPFLQPLGLKALCRAVKKRGLTVMVYSGYTLQALKQHRDPAVTAALDFIDILIDGLFKKNIAANSCWAGSGNQKVHYLSGKYRDYKHRIIPGQQYQEIQIDAAGSITITGF
jgi:anaerobic ribonucleoside-triphosphate reductase activating protein